MTQAKHGVSLLKEECSYFETAVAPYEQYRTMLAQEVLQTVSEHARGFTTHTRRYAREQRKHLVTHVIFGVGGKFGL